MIWIVLIVTLIITAVAQARVKSKYTEYAKVQASSGLTGAEVAKIILNQNGINDVQVQPINGVLTDHYDPRDKTIRLSQGIYDKSTISAVSVAAHEVGHAIQHNESYAFLKFRSTLAPVVQFTSRFVFILIFAGFFLEALGLIDLGIILYSLSVLFHIITLPVEFDASNRAKKHLVQYGIITEAERQGTDEVLGAAAMTYVASMLTSLVQLMRFILMRNSRR